MVPIWVAVIALVGSVAAALLRRVPNRQQLHDELRFAVDLRDEIPGSSRGAWDRYVESLVDSLLRKEQLQLQRAKSRAEFAVMVGTILAGVVLLFVAVAAAFADPLRGSPLSVGLTVATLLLASVALLFILAAIWSVFNALTLAAKIASQGHADGRHHEQDLIKPDSE